MGPVMNLAARRRPDWRSCCTRAPRCRSIEDQPPVVGAVDAGLARRARPASGRGDRILVGGRPRASTTWEHFFIAVGTRPNREVAIALLRDGDELDAPGHAGRRAPTAGSRSATSACCRTCIRTCRAVIAGEPAEQGRAQGGRRHPRGQRRADHVPVAAAGGDREASRASRSRCRSCARRQRRRRIDGDAGARRGDQRLLGIEHRRRDEEAFKPGVVRGRRA